MAFKRHFARVGAAERCTESIFTDHQRQVCDYALVYAEKKNDGEAPYSVSFTATQSGDVIVQMHPHSQLQRAVSAMSGRRRPRSCPRARALRRRQPLPPRRQLRRWRATRRTPPQPHRTRRVPPQEASPPRLRARPPPRACRRRPAAAECAAAPSPSLTRAGSAGSSSAARAAVPADAPMLDPVWTKTRCRRAAAGPRASRALLLPTPRLPSGPPLLTRPAMTPICRTRCSRRRSAGSAARSA